MAVALQKFRSMKWLKFRVGFGSELLEVGSMQTWSSELLRAFLVTTWSLRGLRRTLRIWFMNRQPMLGSFRSPRGHYAVTMVTTVSLGFGFMNGLKPK